MSETKELLDGKMGTYPMRNVREMCRVYLTSLMDVAVPSIEGRCPICTAEASREEVLAKHWRCVEKEMLRTDPNEKWNELLDEEGPL